MYVLFDWASSPRSLFWNSLRKVLCMSYELLPHQQTDVAYLGPSRQRQEKRIHEVLARRGSRKKVFTYKCRGILSFVPNVMLHRESTSGPMCSIRFITGLTSHREGASSLFMLHTAFVVHINWPIQNLIDLIDRIFDISRWAAGSLVSSKMQLAQVSPPYFVVLFAASRNQFASSFMRATIIEYRQKKNITKWNPNLENDS